MNKVNLINIRQKLNIEENTIKKLNLPYLEDSFELTPKEDLHINNITKRLAQLVNLDELVSKLLNSELYGSAYNFVDYSLEDKKIYRINIGLFNRDLGEVEETSMKPELFIDIFTNLTAQQIEKHPEHEKHYKEIYLKLLKYIEKNKYSNQ